MMTLVMMSITAFAMDNESTGNTPDEFEIKIKNLEGQLIHKVRVMKLERYTVDNIFKKHLYILIPYSCKGDI